jgi:transposase
MLERCLRDERRYPYNADPGVVDHRSGLALRPPRAISPVLVKVGSRWEPAGTRLLRTSSDSSGLKVYGAGEWRHEKHGGKPRRTWRRLHLAVDPDSGDILAAELTPTDDGDASQVGPRLDQIASPVCAVLADGAYDGEPIYRTVAERHPDAAVVIPPRSTAVSSDTAETTPTPRDRHIQVLAAKGRMGWQAATGYGKRALVETTFHRYKALIGRSLRARTLSAQKVEARIACAVINRMTRLGMPVARKVA